MTIEEMLNDLEKKYEVYRDKEIWKDVEGYEGLYQVSNLGNIKSIYYSKNKILKPQKDSSGYMQVRLCKNRETKLIFVHRLVRESFYS